MFRCRACGFTRHADENAALESGFWILRCYWRLSGFTESSVFASSGGGRKRVSFSNTHSIGLGGGTGCLSSTSGRRPFIFIL